MNITYLNNPVQNIWTENKGQAKEPFTVNITDKCTYRLIPAGLIRISIPSFKKCINQLAKLKNAEQYINAVEQIINALLVSNCEIILQEYGSRREKDLQHNSKIMAALMQASDKYASWMREAY